MKSPPEDKNMGDAAHEIGRAIVSAVPVVGGPLTVLFENIFTEPLNKRKQLWLEELASVIHDIQDRLDDITPERLSENEMFITAALQASQIALRNHKKEKIVALKNALFNSIQPSAPDEDKQLIFLKLVDDLTPWHLRLLSMLNDPIIYIEQNNIGKPSWSMGGVSATLEHCFPEMKDKRDFYDQLVRDLQTYGLVAQGSFLHTMMTGDGTLASRTSSMGREFINYISRT